MSYQSVGKIRLYCNLLEWLSLNWKDTNITEAYRTLPVIPKNHFLPSGYTEEVALPDNIFTDKNFVAVLGHNFNGLDGWIRLVTNTPGLPDQVFPPTKDILINCDPNSATQGSGANQRSNGFTIANFNNPGNIKNIRLHTNRIDNNPTFGSVIIGNYIDLNSPDLNLTVSRRFGTKRIKTKGGATLTNNMWKTNMWGNRNAWEVWNANDGLQNQSSLARQGIRSWSINFSYLDRKEVFGPNQLLSTLEGSVNGNSGLDSNDYNSNTGAYNYNLLSDDNLFSFINKLNGGQLPFLLQTDTSAENSNDNFAIARFDMDTFEFNQTAHNVYNVKLNLVEEIN